MFRFDRLRELAKNQHRSMRYLCDIAGKSPSYIVDAEKKGSLPKPDAIKTWATALRTTPAYLMGETDDPAESIKKEPTSLMADRFDGDVLAIMEIVQHLSPEDKALVLERCRTLYEKEKQ